MANTTATPATISTTEISDRVFAGSVTGNVVATAVLLLANVEVGFILKVRVAEPTLDVVVGLGRSEVILTVFMNRKLSL